MFITLNYTTWNYTALLTLSRTCSRIQTRFYIACNYMNGLPVVTLLRTHIYTYNALLPTLMHAHLQCSYPQCTDYTLIDAHLHPTMHLLHSDGRTSTLLLTSLHSLQSHARVFTLYLLHFHARIFTLLPSYASTSKFRFTTLHCLASYARTSILLITALHSYIVIHAHLHYL